MLNAGEYLGELGVRALVSDGRIGAIEQIKPSFGNEASPTSMMTSARTTRFDFDLGGT
jgi:hypothetical protein